MGEHDETGLGNGALAVGVLVGARAVALAERDVIGSGGGAAHFTLAAVEHDRGVGAGSDGLVNLGGLGVVLKGVVGEVEGGDAGAVELVAAAQRDPGARGLRPGRASVDAEQYAVLHEFGVICGRVFCNLIRVRRHEARHEARGVVERERSNLAVCVGGAKREVADFQGFVVIPLVVGDGGAELDRDGDPVDAGVGTALGDEDAVGVAREVDVDAEGDLVVVDGLSAGGGESSEGSGDEGRHHHQRRKLRAPAQHLLDCLNHRCHLPPRRARTAPGPGGRCASFVIGRVVTPPPERRCGCAPAGAPRPRARVSASILGLLLSCAKHDLRLRNRAPNGAAACAGAPALIGRPPRRPRSCRSRRC